MSLSQQEVYQLAAETGTHHTTIQRWAAGGGVHPATSYALTEACRRLGIDVPRIEPGAPLSPEARRKAGA